MAGMSNIAAALKSEISRLARKEIRAEVSVLKKAAAQHRRHIAALRRQVEGLQSQLKRTARQTVSGSTHKETGDGDGDERSGLRFRPAGLASHRKRLGLSAADFGRLIGVSGQSVYKWEAGEVRPRSSQLVAIAAVRKMGKRKALRHLEQLS